MRLGDFEVPLPIVQAPMAGVSTPEMAAAVSNAGALGSIAVGATDAAGARTMIAGVRARTDRPFNVNLFVHDAPRRDAEVETQWLEALRPLFAAYGAEPPLTLQPPYTRFGEDDEMLRLLVEQAPPVVSFHFGLPDAARIAALKTAGC
ncbi:MAG: nitronate monooxygenase, partial [Asticcacaulis sp.]